MYVKYSNAYQLHNLLDISLIHLWKLEVVSPDLLFSPRFNVTIWLTSALALHMPVYVHQPALLITVESKVEIILTARAPLQVLGSVAIPANLLGFPVLFCHL